MIIKADKDFMPISILYRSLKTYLPDLGKKLDTVSCCMPFCLTSCDLLRSYQLSRFYRY